MNIKLIVNVCWLFLPLTLIGCSDGADVVENYNVRVSGTDTDGRAVGLLFLNWGYGDAYTPEGTTEVLCDPTNLDRTCEALDIGFEAQGRIWIQALSPQKSDDPECSFWIEGAASFNAQPSDQQLLNIQLTEFGGVCA